MILHHVRPLSAGEILSQFTLLDFAVERNREFHKLRWYIRNSLTSTFLAFHALRVTFDSVFKSYAETLKASFRPPSISNTCIFKIMFFFNICRRLSFGPAGTELAIESRIFHRTHTFTKDRRLSRKSGGCPRNLRECYPHLTWVEEP